MGVRDPFAFVHDMPIVLRPLGTPHQPRLEGLKKQF
eukprot:SAG31_NODE_2422_length_5726_cov_2.047450_4_plen_36_part_00